VDAPGVLRRLDAQALGTRGQLSQDWVAVGLGDKAAMRVGDQ